MAVSKHKLLDNHTAPKKITLGEMRESRPKFWNRKDITPVPKVAAPAFVFPSSGCVKLTLPGFKDRVGEMPMPLKRSFSAREPVRFRLGSTGA